MLWHMTSQSLLAGVCSCSCSNLRLTIEYPGILGSLFYWSHWIRNWISILLPCLFIGVIVTFFKLPFGQTMDLTLRQFLDPPTLRQMLYGCSIITAVLFLSARLDNELPSLPCIVIVAPLCFSLLFESCSVYPFIPTTPQLIILFQGCLQRTDTANERAGRGLWPRGVSYAVGGVLVLLVALRLDHTLLW